MVEAKGYVVADVLTDRDKSAFKVVDRPAYNQVLAGLESGLYDGVAVWKLDRLTRKFSDIGKILGALKVNEALLLTVVDAIDTTTPIGQAIMGIFVAQAEQESLNTSARVKAKWEVMARQGKPHVGGSRCFGFNRDYTINEEEAGVARRIVDEFIGGAALSRIARELNEAGVATASGKRWYASTLRQWMCSPRIAGLRKHNEELHKGTWEAIIPERRWIQAMAEIDKNRLPAARSSERVHLLTGLLFCGVCGGKLRHARFRMSNGKSLSRYQCVKRAGYDSCGGPAVTKEPVDRLVTDEAIALLARGKPIDDGDQTEAALEALIEADKVAAEELTRDHYVNRNINREQLHSLLTDLESRIEINERALNRIRVAPETPELPSTVQDLIVWFGAASPGDARTAVRLVIDRVTLKPAQHRGGNVFNPDRIEISRV